MFISVIVDDCTLYKFVLKNEKNKKIKKIKKTYVYVIKKKVTRTTQDKGSYSYKSHNSAKVNVKSLSDGDNYDEEENISENGDEEGYLLFPDSE